MPVDDVSMENEFLAGVLGANRASGSRDEHRVRLWNGSPNGTAFEVDWGGYTPPVWSADDWLVPDAGVVYSDGLADFGAPSSGGIRPATHWSLHDVDTNVRLYSAPLASPLNVAAEAVDSIRVSLTVPYGRN